jgi:hypothetical protein
VQRTHQIILIISMMLGSWLGMQAVHECGHVLGAWLTGGEVAQVVLYPLAISRTDLAANPHPLVVVWAGPAFGALLPLAVWLVTAAARMPAAFVLRFFAGFCLTANGAYIGAGSFIEAGDCGQMLRHGSPIWTLWFFGAACVPSGIWLWNGQGKHFGLGSEPEKINSAIVWATSIACIALAVLGFLVDGE